MFILEAYKLLPGFYYLTLANAVHCPLHSQRYERLQLNSAPCKEKNSIIATTG